MAKSLFARLSPKLKKAPEPVMVPDLGRIASVLSRQPTGPDAGAMQPAATLPRTIDLKAWLQADIDRLQATWSALLQNPADTEADRAFRRAAHNLYGASAAYGGGALTRLTASLQHLLYKGADLSGDAALVNLHVQACRAAALGGSQPGDDLASAVCEALEAQVHERTSGSD